MIMTYAPSFPKDEYERFLYQYSQKAAQQGVFGGIGNMSAASLANAVPCPTIQTEKKPDSNKLLLLLED